MKKKILTFICVALCFLFVGETSYAENKAVTINEVTIYASSTEISGTTEAIAVTIQVRNSSGIVSMDTAGTKDGKFTRSVAGSFNVGESYTVYVADYEGGSWATLTAVAKADPESQSSGSSDSGSSEEVKTEAPAEETKTTVTKKVTSAPKITEVEPTDKENSLIVPVENIEANISEGISEDAKEKLVEQVAKTVSELVQAILDGDETVGNAVSEETLENIKKALDEGKTIVAVVTIDVMEESNVPSEDKASIEEVLESQKENNIEIACYLDLSIMLKTAEGDELGTYNELTDKVAFTIEAPKDMPCPEGKEYVIIRIHNGESTIIPVTVNADGTLTFETDCLSSYALALRDVQKEEAKTATQTEKEDSEASVESTASKQELTETKSNGWVYAIIGVGVFGIAAAIFFYIRHKKTE